MDRHIELIQFVGDLTREIEEAKALTRSPDDAERRRRGEKILAELVPKRKEAMRELSAIVLAHGAEFRMELQKQLDQVPSPLTAGTIVRLEMLYAPEDQQQAREILLRFCDLRFNGHPEAAERVWFAALKMSYGNLARLAAAIETANGDFRELLWDADFDKDAKAHRKWWPGQTTPAPWYAPKLPPPEA